MSEAAEQPAAAPESRGKRLSPRARTVLLGMATVAAVAIVVWLVHYETRGKYLEGTNDAYIAADSVTVSPRVSGYVEQVLVGDNQDVKAGQPLVLVDPRDYKAQAAQYQAQIDAAQASAANIRAQIGEQEAMIAQSRAQLAASEADARFAAGEVTRYAPLAESGAETHEKLSTLRNQATQAANSAAAQRAALEAAERRIGALKAQVQQASAQGEAAQAQLAAADVNLGSTLIRSSVNGRVGNRGVRVGQFVQAGTRLMSVVPLAGLYVTANFKETQLGLMRPGQPATIEVDSLPGVELRGHVESIAPGTGAEFSLLPPQNATGNFTKIVQRVPVRIAIDAGPEARKVLVAGLSVDVTVDTLSAKGEMRRIKAQEKAQDRAGQ